MRDVLGAGNGLIDYGEVLLVYAALALLMRQSAGRVELNFRRSFWVLYAGWAGCVFVGNYIFYAIGIMSYLPLVNNVLHCFVWIGLCLGYLYSDARRRPLPEQIALFVIYSFLVKVAENRILGTWEKGDFFGFERPGAYIVGWSLMDGLYPMISSAGLRLLGRAIPGVVVGRS